MSGGTADDDRIVPWEALPPEVRVAIGPALPAGHVVWACLRRDGRGRVGTEWWWEDQHGELVEAFWLD